MEYRDLYDKCRKKTGEVIAKNDPIPDGRYYITVMVFVQNSMGQVLLQQRSKDKGGAWATTGGHPKSGETSLMGMQSEILEELGIKIAPSKLILFKTIQTEDDFLDLYYLQQDINLNDIKIQEEEVQNVNWFTKSQIESMITSGEFFKWHIEPYREFLKYLNKTSKADSN